MKKLLFLAVAALCATSITAGNKVSGIIKDAADKSALIGVNISLTQGGQQINGAVTDAHGKFSMETDLGEYVLECSYIGYEPIVMSIAISGTTNLGTIEMHEASTELGEVVVEGQGTIQKVDRQILLPNKEQTAAASDGITLIQNLQIPRIVVNPVDNTVKTLTNQDVQLRINGIEATNAEVMAVNPKDVIRIEYHDQPGVRYNGAAAVVDYIVRHRDTGGSLMLNATNGVTLAGWGEYQLSGKVHFGKSALSLISYYSPRNIYWTRTNTETYNFSTGTMENREIGEPTRFKNNPVNLALTYNLTNGDKNMLNITLRDNMQFMPNSNTNRDSYLYQGTDSFAIHDHESSKSVSPSVDIYYQHNLPKAQTVYFDVVDTYINSKTDRHFWQTPLTGTLADTTDVFSSVRGDKWSLIGEAIYEKAWTVASRGHNSGTPNQVGLTVGAKHTQQWMRNTYLGNVDETVNMLTAETYLFAEVKQRIGKFSYAAGIGAMHTCIEQAGQKQSTWIARPQLTMSVDCGKGVFWKYKVYMSGYQPSLSQLSDVTQQIDKYQLRQGNPRLKPVMFVANETELSWQSKYVTLSLWANYSYDHKPIMEESFEQTITKAPMVVRTYDNQRGFHRLQVAPSIQVRVLQNRLIFTVAPFANYYVSCGNNYKHTHFNPGVRAGIMGMYKGWQFSADVTTRRNNLWGETLEYGEFYHTLCVGYNQDKWGFRVMMMNPLSTKGYSRDTKDLSAIAPNTRHAEMKDFHQMLMLNFHCNLDFGTKHSEGRKRLENEDTDSGILSGAK